MHAGLSQQVEASNSLLGHSVVPVNMLSLGRTGEFADAASHDKGKIRRDGVPCGVDHVGFVIKFSERKGANPPVSVRNLNPITGQLALFRYKMTNQR